MFHFGIEENGIVEHPEIDFATVLASAVHDMKNSLCMLLQSMESLQQSLPPQSSSASQELARIHYEATRLNTNLLQLLSLYRIEKNQLPLHMDEYAVSDLIDEIVIKNQLYSEQKSIEIITECPDHLTWFLDNDLINNLLNDCYVNALRYSKSKLLLRVTVEDQQICFAIHDDGAGYPKHILENADEQMHNLHLGSGRTGLGLFFAHLIAIAHQNQGKTGRIELSNGGEYGGGVFRLWLP